MEFNQLINSFNNLGRIRKKKVLQEIIEEKNFPFKKFLLKWQFLKEEVGLRIKFLILGQKNFLSSLKQE